MTDRSAAEAKARLYQFLQENPDEELLPGENAEYCTRASLFKREGWYKAGTPAIIACGLLLGLSSFFNGACVIGCLAVLFVMAFASDNRLSFALTAAITVVLASLSAKFFINGNAIKPKYQFGFLAEQQTLSSVIKYLGALLGVAHQMKLRTDGQELARNPAQQLAALDQKDKHERQSDLDRDAYDDHDPWQQTERKIQHRPQQETHQSQHDDRQRVHGEAHQDRNGGDASGDASGVHHQVR